MEAELERDPSQAAYRSLLEDVRGGRQGRDGDAARTWFEACRATGVVSDPDDPFNSMSDYELAGWRLARLPDG